MRKNHLVIIFGVIFFGGILILMNSTSFGSEDASNIVNVHGGSMDTNIYSIYLEQSIIKYRFVGSILSLLGGLGVIKNIKITN